MNPTRRLSRKSWITNLVLGVFLLWSGMFICLLPDLGSHPDMQGHGQHQQYSWHSDCMGGGAPTFCKTQGRNGVLVDLHKFAAVDSRLGYTVVRIFELTPSRPEIVNEPGGRLLRLFLVLCSFLK